MSQFVKTFSFIDILGLILAIIFSSGGLNSSTLQDDNKEENNLGKSIYEQKCSNCHGEDGKGNGLAAQFLRPYPLDFVLGLYKVRTTATGSIPTDADIRKSVKEGIHGTAMPSWAPFITGDSLEAIIEYVKSFSSRFAEESAEIVRVDKPMASSAKSILSGKTFYEDLGCADCHGDDGSGEGDDVAELEDDLGRLTVAANLTEPWTFIGGSSAKDIYLRLVTGMNGTPMPSYDDLVSSNQLWDLSNYVISLARKPVWEMDADELGEYYANMDEENRMNPIERGAYLVEYLGCPHCHSPFDEDDRMIRELRMAGGNMFRLGPYGDFVSRNLTPDEETGLGKATDEQIISAITNGIRVNGDRMMPFPMPWPSYAGLSDDDLSALLVYMRSLPPVYNSIPEVKKRNPIEYLWGKFELLILQKPFPPEGTHGNFGEVKVNEQM
ncbi:MAG: c-type cytochrome [Candidatus Marinimicrobia bacterium]|nr:c-type cytochrome [Candidatus Neomarinimicrobiota bacterium]